MIKDRAQKHIYFQRKPRYSKRILAKGFFMKRIVLLCAAFLFAVQGFAQYAYWQGVGGSCVGDFEVASNWQAGSLPGGDQWVCFKNANNLNWKITLNSDKTNNLILCDTDSLNYETLFVLNQHVWTTTNNMYFRKGVGGSVTFTNGTLRSPWIKAYSDTAAVSNYLKLAMKDVDCGITYARFGASTSSFEGGSLAVSGFLTVGFAGYGKATVNLDRNVQCSVTNGLNIGYDSGATGELVNVNGALRQYGFTNSFVVGKDGCGTLTTKGGSTYLYRSPAIGVSGTGVGTLNVLGGSNTFATQTGDRIFIGNLGRGTLLAGGGTNSAVGIELADSSGGTGEMTLTNGLWNIAEHMWVGYSGTGVFNVNGGEMHFLNAGPVLAVARNAGATGLVTVAGGLLDVNGAVWLGRLDSGTVSPYARLVLTGSGVLRTKQVFEYSSAVTSQILFDGGALQAAASGALAYSVDDVRLTANGMVVDTAGYANTVALRLRDAAGQSGAITKKGAGTLTLAGTREATGPVSVLGGTLVASNDLAVAAGTSRIDGTLALSASYRLIAGAGAALAGTGSVARVTLQDGAVFARDKSDSARTPLTVSDCVADNRLTVALTGYSLMELRSSLPLIRAPTAFMEASKITVTLNGQPNSHLTAKFAEAGGQQVLYASYSVGTMVVVY